MRNFDKKDQAAVVAFIGVRLRNLTLDAMGKISFVENADDIFEDIFGVKKFISKNVFAGSRYDIYTNLERVGIDILFDLCNGGMYEIISDLIGITVRLDELDRQFKKLKRKGKKISQRDEKEFKYLHKLYKESIKKLGKRFDTSVGKSYKQRYNAISSFLEREHDFFGNDSIWSYNDDEYGFENESIMSHLDDGYGSYSRGYDSYGDYDDNDSPFERFVSKSKSTRGRVKKSRRVDDDYEEERPYRNGRRQKPMHYEEEYDDDYEDEYEKRPRMNRSRPQEDEEESDAKELKGAIMKLANVVAHVAKEQKVIREVAENAYDAAAALYDDEEEGDESEDFSANVAETLDKVAPQGVIKNTEIDDIINASMWLEWRTSYITK